MAEQFISLRENDHAVSQYKEALKFSPHEITILASLAKLYMQVKLRFEIFFFEGIKILINF